MQKGGALWRSTKVSELEVEYLEQEIRQIHTHSDYDVDIFNIDLLKINVSNTSINNLKDFKIQVIKSNHLDTVLVDTGAKVSAWIATQSTKRGFTEKMQLFNSPPVSVTVLSWSTVTHGHSSVPVEWYLTEGTFESILSGAVAKQLDIIYFTPAKNVFQPINMIHNQNKDQLQQILSKYSHNFKGLGKLKAH